MLGSNASTKSLPSVVAWTALTLNDLHYQLGHASQDKLLHMLDEGQLQGATLIVREFLTIVMVAHGKQHRGFLKTA